MFKYRLLISVDQIIIPKMYLKLVFIIITNAEKFNFNFNFKIQNNFLSLQFFLWFCQY